MASEPITASVAIQAADAVMGPPTASYAYLSVASEMMPGILHLLNGGVDTAPALAMLAGHTLECLLKAYVSRCIREGDKKDAEVHADGHNLRDLWKEAQIEKLMGWSQEPKWVDEMFKLHARPFALRYLKQDKTNFLNGLVTPDSRSMVDDVGALLQRVKEKFSLT